MNTRLNINTNEIIVEEVSHPIVQPECIDVQHGRSGAVTNQIIIIIAQMPTNLG